MNKQKTIQYLDKIAIGFETAIAALLLIVIAIKLIDNIMETVGIEYVILQLDFNELLSTVFILVIGVEFVRMLFKHTPESVIDVLLFALARHLVLYNEGSITLLLGVLSIAILFATKKFLIPPATEKIKNLFNKNKEQPKENQ